MATKSATKLSPIADKVVVKATENQEKTKGGLFIPDTVSKDRPQEGEVIAVGPGRYEDGKIVPMTVKAGDRVIFGKYSGNEIKLDDEDLIIIKEADILAIIN